MTRLKIFTSLLIFGVSVIFTFSVLNQSVAQSSGVKICSVFVSGMFRDTISVPMGWNDSVCRRFMKSVGANGYQLGCVFDSNFSLGGTDGELPSKNCGWQ